MTMFPRMTFFSRSIVDFYNTPDVCMYFDLMNQKVKIRDQGYFKNKQGWRFDLERLGT
jgi:hypothetical protein